ncbi:hypothetical protein NL676_031803 [Syzygium grande]|nr:hypothetical protein NL676_031803 [Syzygium grande]
MAGQGWGRSGTNARSRGPDRSRSRPERRPLHSAPVDGNRPPSAGIGISNRSDRAGRDLATITHLAEFASFAPLLLSSFFFCFLLLLLLLLRSLDAADVSSDEIARERS